MGKHETLREKILRNKVPSDIRPKELQSFLLAEGFHLLRTRGDHFIYEKPGGVELVIPMQNPVKQVYVKQIRDAIRDYEDEKGNN